MAYSAERKAAVLKKMLPPNDVPLRQLSQDEGIFEATLHSWRKEARSMGQLLPDADAGPQGWSSRNKFAAVVETAAMNAADLAESSRPRVSNDNFFSEALFRTCKYRPGWPSNGFSDIEAARSWLARFVSCYNGEHLHSAIRHAQRAAYRTGARRAGCA